MSSRLVAIATSRVAHLSARPDMVPVCGFRPAEPDPWRFYEVKLTAATTLPLCANCAGVLNRLLDLAVKCAPAEDGA